MRESDLLYNTVNLNSLLFEPKLLKSYTTGMFSLPTKMRAKISILGYTRWWWGMEKPRGGKEKKIWSRVFIGLHIRQVERPDLGIGANNNNNQF